MKYVVLNANIRETDAFEERHIGTPKEQVISVPFNLLYRREKY